MPGKWFRLITHSVSYGLIGAHYNEKSPGHWRGRGDDFLMKIRFFL